MRRQQAKGIVSDNGRLVAAALADGPEGFAPIIERYKDAMFGVAWVRLRNFHDVEDVIQEAFVQAYQGLASLRDPHRLGAWLRSIVIHQCSNYKKRHAKKTEVEALLLDTAPTLQAQLDQQEIRERAWDVVGQLGEVQQETVTLFYLEAYSLAEIARIQEVPVGTVKSRLHTARQSMKKEMIAMVTETLKENAPDEEFVERVFKMLSRYPEQRLMPQAGRHVHLEIARKLGEIGLGPPTFAAVRKAMASPHWPTRAYALKSMHLLVAKQRYEPGFPRAEAEAIVQMGLADENRRVRRQAFRTLGWLEPDRDKRREFMPIICSLLLDKSNELRRFVGDALVGASEWHGELPVAAVAEAFLEAPNEKTRASMERLLRRVVDCQKGTAV